MPKYTIVVRNRFTRTVYSITETNSREVVYRTQDNYLVKFCIKAEVERWD